MVDSMNPDYNLAEKQVEYNAWYGYVTERLETAKVYFESRFIKEPVGDRPTVTENCFGHLMKMWEAMALTNPDYLRRKYAANNNDIRSLQLFVESQLRVLIQMKRIEEEKLNPLIAQLFPYLQRAIEINWDTVEFPDKVLKLVEFWKTFRITLKHWSELAFICFLHQPSSAASERVFSVLKHILDEEKVDALDDYIEAFVYSRLSDSL